jgi:hypothetical protein
MNAADEHGENFTLKWMKPQPLPPPPFLCIYKWRGVQVWKHTIIYFLQTPLPSSTFWEEFFRVGGGKQKSWWGW